MEYEAAPNYYTVTEVMAKEREAGKGPAKREERGS